MENLENKNLHEKDILKDIKLSDYENPKEGLREWLEGEDIPEILWDRIKNLSPELSIRDLIGNIRKELFDIYGKKRNMAKSFADS